MPARIIAIGDIHGCSSLLDALLDAIGPGADDAVVTLGDHIDRGPDSRGVVERLLRLRERTRLVPLKGNHEQMMLEAIAAGDDSEMMAFWRRHGGDATLASYGGDWRSIPDDHLEFLLSAGDLHAPEAPVFFAHGSYDPARPLDDQPVDRLRWGSLRDEVPAAHASGRTAIVGHTSQKSGEILDLGHVVCIDTYAFGGGRLTALDVGSWATWQAGPGGEIARSTRPRRGTPDGTARADA